jgi:hypothetical protein
MGGQSDVALQQLDFTCFICVEPFQLGANRFLASAGKP